MGQGDELQWHFDQTDFVVSLAIRDAEVGGDFEVVPASAAPTTSTTTTSPPYWRAGTAPGC